MEIGVVLECVVGKPGAALIQFPFYPDNQISERGSLTETGLAGNEKRPSQTSPVPIQPPGLPSNSDPSLQLRDPLGYGFSVSQRLALTNIFRITICQLFLQGSPFTIACIQAMCKSHWAETWPCVRLAWMQLTNTKFIQFSLAKNIRFFCLQMLKFRCLSKLIKDKGTTLEKITANTKVILESNWTRNLHTEWFVKLRNRVYFFCLIFAAVSELVVLAGPWTEILKHQKKTRVCGI